MAKEDQPKNKGGRPRKHPVGTRVPTLAFRVRAGLRDKLEVSANQYARSISEEIERRLEQSFADEEAQGGPHTTSLLRFIVTGVRLMEDTHDAKWTDDLATAAACRAFIDTSLDSFMKAAAPVRQGILGMLIDSQFAEDRALGERMALAMRRERLRRSVANQGDETGAFGEEIASIDARLRRMDDPFSEPPADVSHVGNLGLTSGGGAPGILSGLLSQKPEEPSE